MILNTRQWGVRQTDAVVCLHGMTQHGGIYEPLGKRLALGGAGRFVVAADLRGHGDSTHEPPWHTESQVADLVETLDDLGIERAAWIGHSYGALVAAALAAQAPERVTRIVLLDPAMELPSPYVLAAAEIDRLDWSFATPDGAINALASSDGVITTPRETLAAYVQDDLQRGADGRLRFRFCPSSVVVFWNETTRPAPEIAEVPTLILRPVASHLDGRAQDRRYRQTLGSLLKIVAVPGGHNLLWESPDQVASAIEEFLAAG